MAAPGHVPAEAVALAHRLGIEEPRYGGSILLRQTGRLRSDSRARWMRFKARQHIAVDRCAFAWRAGVGPLGFIHVEDALDGVTPIGRVAALGMIPLARSEYSVPLLKGEVMRYLAEMPWAPDAILANSELQWEAQGEGRLAVSATIESSERERRLDIGTAAGLELCVPGGCDGVSEQEMGGEGGQVR